MKNLSKVLPWLLITGAIVALPFILTAEPNYQARKAVNSLHAQARKAVNSLHAQMQALPTMPITVGHPPDTLYAGDRVVELPEDGHQWATILVVDQGPLSQHLINEIDNTPRLRDLWTQTKHYTFQANDMWVTKNNRQSYPMPQLLVQRPTDPNGSNNWERVYDSWGSGIPAHGEHLADQIQEMIGRSVARRPCPSPQPSPSPVPQPQPVQPVQPMVPMTPEETPAEEQVPLWVWMAAALGGGGLGAFAAAKKAYAP